MKRHHHKLTQAVAICATIALLELSAWATDGTWISTATGPSNWSVAGNWNGGSIADGALSTASFTSNITATTTVNLDSGRNIGNLTFSDNGASGSSWVLSGTTLTLGDGITAGGSTINTTTNATISLVLAGANTLNKTGSRNLYLTGSNTYTGGTTITNAGILGINADAALGATPATFDADNIIFNGGGLTNHNGSTYVNVTLNANRGIMLAGNATFYSGVSSGIARTLAVEGVISGAGNLSTSNGGIVALNGLNTYSGKTTIGGNTVLSVNTLKNVGDTTGSSVGNVTTVANGTIDFGSATSSNASTLRYTGAGSTTDRILNLGNTTYGASIDHAGSGTLRFTGNITATGAGSKTLTLQGSTSGVGEISGSIMNNSASNITSLTKDGTGVWVLSGSNAYTGTTTVTAGTLSAAGNGAIGNSSGITVASEGTLLLAGDGFNRVGDSVSLALGGGVLSTEGLSNQQETMGAFSLTANSTIDFGSGLGNHLLFASVGEHTVDTVLSILGWSGINGVAGNANSDRLLFVGSVSDFTSAYNQDDVLFNGVVGYQAIDIGGGQFEIVAVPEPSTIVLAVASLVLVLAVRRRSFLETLRTPVK